MEEDTRAMKNLTLLKRLYLNNYNDKFPGDISCIGHFDAIKISDAGKIDDYKCLYLNKGNYNLSYLWKMISEVNEGLNGKFNAISFSLIRSLNNDKDKEEEEEFWKELLDKETKEINNPFFCFCFLKVFNYNKINTVKEQIITDKQNECLPAELLIYNTYDHADLIIVIKSDNLTEIKKTLLKIVKTNYVLFTNTILGSIIDDEKSTNFQENELIGDLRINLSAGGIKKVIDYFNSIKNINTINKNSLLFYTFGENNYFIDIKNVTNKNFYDILKNDIEKSNDNLNFPIHSVQTQIIFNLLPSTQKEDDFCQVNTDCIKEDDNILTEIINVCKEKEKNSWCKYSIDIIGLYLGNETFKNDDRIYIRLITLLKIINTLYQYECNILGEDIFNLFLPVLSFYFKRIFFQNNEKILKKYFLKKLLKKDIIVKLFNIIDRTINRLIHTDHKFMLVPGYNGMFFDIPIKLCLMYVTFLYNVANVLSALDFEPLNEKNKYPYRIIFIPSMDKGPYTKVDEKYRDCIDKVIWVNVPQKHLYYPRSLFVILTHEIAHYIGLKIRLREVRRELVIQMVANILYFDIFMNYKETIVSRETFSKDVLFQIYLIIKEKKENLEYDDTIKDEEILIDAFETFMLIFSVRYENVLDNIKLRSISYYNTLINTVIYDLYSNCRETFADICTILLLDVDIITYLETFAVSEGKKLDLKDKPDIDRISVVIKTLISFDEKYKAQWEELLKEDSLEVYKNGKNSVLKRCIKLIKLYIDKKESCRYFPYEVDASIIIDRALYPFTTWKLELRYISECYNEIKKRLSYYDKIIQENNIHKKLKKLWDFFQVKENGEDKYDEKLNNIFEFINDYKEIVDTIKEEDIKLFSNTLHDSNENK